MSYETIIGLEVHAELKTKSKIFCSCSTEFGAAPNEHSCPICMGLPGTLPVLNEEVVNLAIKAGTLLHCTINKVNKMDRKNYFYPDLPKAYQISQYDLPMCSNGYVEAESEGKKFKVRINRIHIEEDAGKLVHPEGEPYSLIDYNRVGVPLAEIVSEPDIRSPKQAVDYIKKLKSILEYGGISDCRMEQGSLRCDANISVKDTAQEGFNTKVEIKNISSFRELFKALTREEKRQRELYQFGEGYKVKQETRRWDSGKGRTVPMRSKEDANDYRYFPDPDLPPIIIEDGQVDELKSTIPEMPWDREKRFAQKYNLSQKDIDILIDDKTLGDYFESVVMEGANPQTAANWILTDMLRLLKGEDLDSSKIPISSHDLFKLISLVEKGKISNTIGKEIFDTMFTKGGDPEEIVKKKGLSQISDTSELEAIIESVISKNPKSVEDYKSGKTQAAGYLVGQVMKKTHGKANPKIARELIEKSLS